MKPILSSFALIAAGLLAGYGVQLFAAMGVFGPEPPIARLRSFLQRLVLLGLSPVTFIGALWIVEIREPKIAWLAAIGAFCHVFGGAAAALLAPLLRLDRPKAGAFFCCGFFTNVGAIGGLVVFLFLGEEGYAFVPVFKLLEELVYYGAGFPAARLYGDAGGKEERSLPARLLRDPFFLVALAGLVVGSALNLSGVPRPAVFSSLNSLLIPLNTVILLSSIGMAMRFGRTGRYLGEGVAIMGLKFLLVPAVCTALARTAGLEGLPLKAVLILSSMPVAFNSLIPPSLYGLDLDLANSCFLISVLGLVLLLPGLHFILPLI
ncbi:MAG: AEC family transporter [Aminivibrio sp.]|jgi:predicted permease